jgi:hypothetical protein
MATLLVAVLFLARWGTASLAICWTYGGISHAGISRHHDKWLKLAEFLSKQKDFNKQP